MINDGLVPIKNSFVKNSYIEVDLRFTSILLNKQLADNLKSLRQNKKWNQGRVARAVNISTPAYSKIENGSSNISFNRMEQFARLYHLTLTELITGDKVQASSDYAHLADLLAKADQQIIEIKQKITRLSQELEP